VIRVLSARHSSQNGTMHSKRVSPALNDYINRRFFLRRNRCRIHYKLNGPGSQQLPHAKRCSFYRHSLFFRQS